MTRGRSDPTACHVCIFWTHFRSGEKCFCACAVWIVTVAYRWINTLLRGVVYFVTCVRVQVRFWFCHHVVLDMCLVCGGVLACISPIPLHLLCILAITSVPCRAVCCRMSWGAVSLVDPACNTIRDYDLHCAGLHIRYARVTVGSQVLI